MKVEKRRKKTRTHTHRVVLIHFVYVDDDVPKGQLKIVIFWCKGEHIPIYNVTNGESEVTFTHRPFCQYVCLCVRIFVRTYFEDIFLENSLALTIFEKKDGKL